MESPRADSVSEYRSEMEVYPWAGVVGGTILVIVGFFFGLWFTVVGALLILLGALRAWTLDLMPDDVIAKRLEARRQAQEEERRRLERLRGEIMGSSDTPTTPR